MLQALKVPLLSYVFTLLNIFAVGSDYFKTFKRFEIIILTEKFVHNIIIIYFRSIFKL